MLALKNSCFILFVLLLLAGCDERLIDYADLDISPEQNFEIVIEGFITTEKTRYQVKLSKPVVQQADTSQFVPITSATVQLMEGANTYLYELIDQEKGIYQTIDSLSGTVGKTYTLVVDYENHTYTATDSIVLCDSVIDYPIDEICQPGRSYQIDSKLHNFGYQSPSWWWYSQNPDRDIKDFSEDVSEQTLYNHQGSRPQGLFPFIEFGYGYSVKPEDTVELIRQVPSPAYYAYSVSLFNVTDWSTGNFSVVPGNTLSNVSAGGTGFFYTTDVVRFRITGTNLVELSGVKCFSKFG